MKFGIFTKPIHVEKIVNFLNTTDIEYLISTDKNEIYAFDFDIGVSYCWPFRINIDDFPDILWYNYHPGLLPQYPGPDEYARAISNGVAEYGVTLHKMTNQIDQGPILHVKRFKLESPPVSTNEIGCITHYHLFQLFKQTIETLQLKPYCKEDFKRRCHIKTF